MKTFEQIILDSKVAKNYLLTYALKFLQTMHIFLFLFKLALSIVYLKEPQILMASIIVLGKILLIFESKTYANVVSTKQINKKILKLLLLSTNAKLKNKWAVKSKIKEPKMSYDEVIQIYTNFLIDSDLLNKVKIKCENLDLNFKASFKVFQ